MKAIATLATALALLWGSASIAQEHHVSSDALSAIGLGGMQTVSSAKGQQVRGKWSVAFGQATSLHTVSGTLYDPNTGSHQNYSASNYGHKKTVGANEVVTVAAAASGTTGLTGFFTVDAAGNTAFVGAAGWGMIGFGAGASLQLP